MFSVLLSIFWKERPEYLRLSLDSIINQTLPPDEIILVKDGRLTPELDQVIEEYQQKYKELFKVFAFAENRGLGSTLAFGLLQCSHEIVARMDTDDIAREDRFEKQYNFLQEHPEIALVGSNVAEFNTNKDDISSYRILPEYPEIIKQFGKKRNPVNHPTVMYKKSKVLEVGNYQHVKNNIGFEDYYLWIRMLNYGLKFYNIQDCLLYMRTGNDMIGRRHGRTYFLAEKDCFQKSMNMGYINRFTYTQAILTRGFVRLVPKRWTKFIYSKFLREK